VRKYGLQTFVIHFIKNIVIVIIIIIFSLKQQVENDDTNDGLPDRTTPAVFDIAVKSLTQNSAEAVFTSYPELSPAVCIDEGEVICL
jgi:predicted secreted protein